MQLETVAQPVDYQFGDEVHEEPVIEIEKPREHTFAEKVAIYGYSSEGGFVKVGSETYLEDEFKRLMAEEESGYVQNEEQKESNQWNKVISEQEYRSKAEKHLKDESNNNTNNPTRYI
jgi:hypothetical protein